MKLKTHQGIAKRFTITKRKKILRRKSGQDHFNAREAGKVTRGKRRDILFSKVFEKVIKQHNPYR